MGVMEIAAVEKVFLTVKGAKYKRKGRKVKILILNPLRTLRTIFAFSAVNGFRLFLSCQ
jgi:hypothetical protein